MQQQVQDALLAHDRIQRSTELPVFYGIPHKETVTARNLIDRLETTARIAAWPNDARKCEGLYMLLREEALIWWRSLKAHGVDQENWDQVKRAFLKYYEPKYSVATTCSNLQDLHQRPGEPVHRYYLRLFDALEKFKETQPPLRAVQHAPAPGAALADADLVAAKQEGANEQDMFMRRQLFLAGLSDRFRTKAMEAAKATLGEAVDYAIELERIYQRDVKKVNAVQDSDNDPAPPEDWDDEELAAVNAIRMRKGKPPFRRFQSNNNSGSNPRKTGSAGSLKCRYCKKMGHMQKECRSRIRDGAPMVDQNGHPFKKVQAVESLDSNAPEGSGAQASGAQVSTLRQIEPEQTYHLNW